MTKTKHAVRFEFLARLLILAFAFLMSVYLFEVFARSLQASIHDGFMAAIEETGLGSMPQAFEAAREMMEGLE